jgi:putative ABC transport system substrate-binding protein
MRFIQLGRRQFITLLGGAAVAWPLVVRAQQRGKIPRIGVLWHAASAEEEGPYFKGLIEGLRNLGYFDGLNIILEHRFPNETPDRFRSMAAELVSLKVDALIGVGSQTAPYVKNATTTIPIIFVFSPDPVGTRAAWWECDWFNEFCSGSDRETITVSQIGNPGFISCCVACES